jgi:hypothetical protein
MLGNRQKMVRSLDFLAGSVTAWEALRHHPQQLRRLGLFDASAPTMIQEIGFAPDSPLEGGVMCELVSVTNSLLTGK